MTIVRNQLATVESARRERVEPTGGITATNTQKALEGLDTGTLKSLTLTVPAELSVTGSPTSGNNPTIAISKATQTANLLYAGPSSGAAAAPTFRAMVSADIPAAIVAYASIQNVAASRVLGNPTGSPAAPSEISLGATLAFSGSALQTAAHTGDVTTATNSFATTVAKIQGTAVGGVTGTGNVVFSDSPNLTTALLVGRNSIGAGNSDGIVVRNATAAAAGAQQFSPALRFSAQGWRTNATAQSEQVDWTFINEAVQGTADPSSNLTFNFQVNSAGYAQKFKMGSGGTFDAAAGYTIGGVALAAANLSNGVSGSGAVALVNAPTFIAPILGAATGTSLTLANGTVNGLQFTAAAGTNGALAMGAGGSLIFILGSTVDAFAVNDHGSTTIFGVTEGTPGTPTSTAVTTPGNLAILNTTAIPAGGTAAKGYLFSSTSNFGVFFGSGAPTLSAAQGSLYLRSDGSSTSTRAYVNTNGSTTWTNITTAA